MSDTLCCGFAIVTIVTLVGEYDHRHSVFSWLVVVLDSTCVRGAWFLCASPDARDRRWVGLDDWVGGGRNMKNRRGPGTHA
jgi:hypothetical protein